ncbi:MAG: hypothetical protein BMS9Abin06_0714 [Gammaproteobacteria bacterium]|nr:MAG: hypothetical protein BMS9Abin06_0714 [Gammaproteobacteria bacterium]
MAIKEAARYWLWQHSRVLLYPADINILEDAQGRPVVAGEGLEAFGGMPLVSVSYAAGRAIALASASEEGLLIDLEALLSTAQAS